MGRRRMIRSTVTLLTLLWAPLALAEDFRPVGDYLLKSYFKLTGEKVTPVAMKPIVFHVFTDGVKIRISADGDQDSHTTFEIFRSDGIGRQRPGDGALEIIPGVQAMSRTDGMLRHLRLSRESLTITAFPGVSDQTIVTYAVAAEPAKDAAAATVSPP